MEEDKQQLPAATDPEDLDNEVANVEPTDDYEELPATQGVSFLERVSDVQDKLNTGLSMAQNITDVYGRCMELRERRKTVEAMTQAKLANTVAKFKIAQDAMTHVFGERNSALQKDYEVLDKAIALGDREMIIQAMGRIGDIVTTSPLNEIKELCERFDDPDDSLLDF